MVDMYRFSHPAESFSLSTYFVPNILLDVFLHKSFLWEDSDGPIREYDALVTIDHVFSAFSFIQLFVSPISFTVFLDTQFVVVLWIFTTPNSFL